MDPWNPEQYHRFRDERRQPFFDLLELVRPRLRMRIVDLGCGTGELTTILHQRLRAAETLGIDASENMLEQARRRQGGGVRFEKADIRELRPTVPYDLVFSNAVLQWLPDHPQLLRQLNGFLAAEGQLAIQVPANHDHPAYTIAAEIARQSPFSRSAPRLRTRAERARARGVRRLVERPRLSGAACSSPGVQAHSRVQRGGRGLGQGHTAHRVRASPASAAVRGVSRALPVPSSSPSLRHTPLFFSIQADSLVGTTLGLRALP